MPSTVQSARDANIYKVISAPANFMVQLGHLIPKSIQSTMRSLMKLEHKIFMH